MSKEFAFAKSQRVKVPGKTAEGIVTGRAEYTDGENDYYVLWFSNSGAKCQQWFGETVLSGAQSPAQVQTPRPASKSRRK